MNKKYTLMSKYNRNKWSADVRLYIGSWIQPYGEWVVLTHGTLSDSEYNYISKSSIIGLYESSELSWFGLSPYYSGYCYVPDKRSDNHQLIGMLKRSDTIPNTFYKNGVKFR